MLIASACSQLYQLEVHVLEWFMGRNSMIYVALIRIEVARNGMVFILKTSLQNEAMLIHSYIHN